MEANNSENTVRVLEEEEEGTVVEDEEILKRRISCHPLYELLLQTHLDCLKVSLGDTREVGITALNQANTKLHTTLPSRSDLDHFMEAYCMALGELKEAMEEPLQETAAFIDAMHFELKELMGTHTHPTDTKPTSTSPGK